MRTGYWPTDDRRSDRHLGQEGRVPIRSELTRVLAFADQIHEGLGEPFEVGVRAIRGRVESHQLQQGLKLAGFTFDFWGLRSRGIRSWHC